MNRIAYHTVAAIVGLAGVAHAQVWTVVNLRPAGSTNSQAYSIRDGQQAGIAAFNGRIHAGYWSGTAASFVDLDSPDFALGSAANAIDNGVIVGVRYELDADENDYSRAVLWNGSAQNYVDLQPLGPEYTQSIARAIRGSHQGGNVRINDLVNHAALWSGTPESFVDLHPPAATNSYILGMSDTQQVGYAVVGLSHASLWSGTPESWVDLHPDIAFASQGYATDGELQVGWSIFNNGIIISHPAFWAGSAASYVDLLPTGWRDGQALAVLNGIQVGYARASLNDPYHAMVWRSDPNDFTDLNQFLPVGVYIRAFAYDIWSDGQFIYVVGIGVLPDFNSDPLLWMTPVAGGNPCDPDVNQDGVADQGDVDYLINVIAGGENPTGIDPDFNSDGVADQGDVDAIINVVAGGDCP